MSTPEYPICSWCLKPLTDGYAWTLDDGYGSNEQFHDTDCFVKWLKKEFDLR
jgi:hypothetical protein